MFNPAPRIERIPITPRHACYVVDDALLEPARWVDYAVAHAHEFAQSPHNAYPGPELRMDDAVSGQLDTFFARHLRAQLGAARTERMYSRMSLATRAPGDLHPRQRIPHVDRLDATHAQCLVASVLYLFDDAALGGTSFYMPRRPRAEILRLMAAANALPGDAFEQATGIGAAYMRGSNDWFEHVLTVPARYNRLIVYDGGLFHSGDIAMPGRLTADPRRGRLTWNGFFMCTRALVS